MKLFPRLSADFWVAVCASVLWAVSLWHVRNVDLMASHYDEYTHIISARLMFDSMTPGISQLGFWAPLLHIVIMPFFAVPVLAETDTASAVAILPLLCVTAVVFRRCLAMFVSHGWIATFGAVLFSLNPYILFFSVTPMAEMVMMCGVVCAMYSFALWMKSDSLTHVVYTGVFVSFSCLARFEAFMLVPATTAAVVLIMVLRRYAWARFEATFLLFILPALSGIAFIVIYSLAYSGQFLAYGSFSLNPAPLVEAQVAGQGALGLPWRITTLLVWYCTVHMNSLPLMVGGLLSLPLVLLLSRDRMRIALVAVIGLAPAIFVYATILLDRLGMAVPELNGPGAFNNVRYLLSTIFAAITGVVLLWDLILSALRKHGVIRFILSVPFVLACLTAAGLHLREQAFLDPPYPPMFYEKVPLQNRFTYPVVLRTEYDYGKILTVRYNNDYFLIESGLPLSAFVIESNFQFFDQVVREPWLFARWVAFPRAGRWKFPEFDALERSEAFQHFYTKVAGGPDESIVIYRLNEEYLRMSVRSLGYDTMEIPSLNAELTRWHPQKIYREMQGDNR